MSVGTTVQSSRALLDGMHVSSRRRASVRENGVACLLAVCVTIYSTASDAVSTSSHAVASFQSKLNKAQEAFDQVCKAPENSQEFRDRHVKPSRMLLRV